MAKDKKTVVIYSDWIATFDKLTDEEAGKLIKHLLRYVNDQNPEADRMTELLFAQMQQQLKRDLKKWEQIKEARSKAGRFGGIKSGETRRSKTKQNFNIILGHANVGKTYWLLWYLLSLSHKHNLKHLIYSAENTVHGIKRNLIELYSGRKIKGMPKEQLEECKQFVESHFDFIDSSKAWQLEEFMQEAQKDTSYDTLMIDPHNSFLRPRGVNPHEYDYEMATRLRLFCKKTDTTVYLCIHAATEALRKTHKDGDFNGHPMPPSMADAEGGGKWGNRADDFLVIHRYVADPTNWMWTHVHVKKVKETETGGMPTMLNDPIRFQLHNGTQFLCSGVNVLDMFKDNEKTNSALNFYDISNSVPF